jgi:hypothetical protein
VMAAFQFTSRNFAVSQFAATSRRCGIAEGREEQMGHS